MHLIKSNNFIGTWNCEACCISFEFLLNSSSFSEMKFAFLYCSRVLFVLPESNGLFIISLFSQYQECERALTPDVHFITGAY